MPLVTISSQQAVENLKSNPVGMWPKRGQIGRLSPIAKPKIAPSFHLDPGEPVFTIGSCFARNVERALLDRGFDLPAHEVVEGDESFRSIGVGILNNYGTPSIYNEIAWAFDDNFDERQCFVETDGKWIDLHLLSALRPASLTIVKKRRELVREAYRSIQRCRTIIITLGLAECWFDNETSTYLNQSPRRGLMKAFPDRFELRVLSFDEVYGFLKGSLDKIKLHGREDVRVVLTVSPVPLSGTYRDIDVMVANAYSKSVLRTAVEHAITEYPFIDYFPSYESITLSEREEAWTDDNVHVTEEIVRVNVGRMVDAYTKTEARSLADLHEIINEMKTRPFQLFSRLRGNEQYLSDPIFADAYVEGAFASRERDLARAAVEAGDVSDFLAARVHLWLDDPHRALSLLETASEHVESNSFRHTHMRALLAIGELERAIDVANEWVSGNGRVHEPYRLLALHVSKTDKDAAARYFALAFERAPDNDILRLEYAEFLARNGRAEEGRNLAQSLIATSNAMQSRLSRLLESA